MSPTASFSVQKMSQSSSLSWKPAIFAILIVLAAVQAIFSQGQENSQINGDYSGSVNGPVSIGGRQYDFAPGSQVAVKGGSIASFEGTLNSEAEIGGNKVQGTMRYSEGKYSVTDGTINGVGIKSASDITVSGDSISGIAGKNCDIDGNSINEDAKFSYNKKEGIMEPMANEGVLSTTNPVITKANPDTMFVGKNIMFQVDGKDAFTLDASEPTRVVIGNGAPDFEGNSVVIDKLNRQMRISGNNMEINLQPNAPIERATIVGSNVKVINGGLSLIFNDDKTLVEKKYWNAVKPLEIVNGYDPEKAYKVLKDKSYFGVVVNGPESEFTPVKGISVAVAGVERAYVQIEGSGDNVRVFIDKRTLFELGNDELERQIGADFKAAGLETEKGRYSEDQKLYLEAMKGFDSVKSSPKGSKLVFEKTGGRGILTLIPTGKEPSAPVVFNDKGFVEKIFNLNMQKAKKIK